jgi:hypothetical protein
LDDREQHVLLGIADLVLGSLGAGTGRLDLRVGLEIIEDGLVVGQARRQRIAFRNGATDQVPVMRAADRCTDSGPFSGLRQGNILCRRLRAEQRGLQIGRVIIGHGQRLGDRLRLGSAHGRGCQYQSQRTGDQFNAKTHARPPTTPKHYARHMGYTTCHDNPYQDLMCD